MLRKMKVVFAIVVGMGFLVGSGLAAELGPLRAGAARIEITPDANAIPRPFTSILDSLYARAIFLDNGHDRAVLLNADVGAIATATTDKVVAEISQQLNVPVANILISATHDHSAIFGGPRPPAAAAAPLSQTCSNW
jgi:neutral ceramidase